MNIRFILEGQMPSKKNNYRRAANGRMYIPEDIKAVLDDFLWQLKNIRNKQRFYQPFICPVVVTANFYNCKNPDTDNMFTTLLDLLQKAQIIKNDKLVRKHFVDESASETRHTPFVEVFIEPK